MTTNLSWFDRVINGLAVVASVFLCVLVILICVDVTGRSTGAFTIPWTLDASEFALYLITFLAAPWVLREQGHIADRNIRGETAECGEAVGGCDCEYSRHGCLWHTFAFSTIQLWRSFVSGNLVYETFVYAEWYQYAIAPPIFCILLNNFPTTPVRYRCCYSSA